MLTFIFEEYPKAYTTSKQFEETTVTDYFDEATQIHIEGKPEDYPEVYTTFEQFEESTVSEHVEEAVQNEGNLE